MFNWLTKKKTKSELEKMVEAEEGFDYQIELKPGQIIHKNGLMFKNNTTDPVLIEYSAHIVLADDSSPLIGIGNGDEDEGGGE